LWHQAERGGRVTCTRRRRRRRGRRRIRGRGRYRRRHGGTGAMTWSTTCWGAGCARSRGLPPARRPGGVR